jgi:addiction module HigA family antidote
MNAIHNPAHPGEILQDFWPEGLTLTAAAQQLNMPRATLANILNGDTCITADIANRLNGWGGISAERWLSMQNLHTQWIERVRSRTNEANFHVAA